MATGRVATGLSGHGFKFAPVLGKYLVDLTEHQEDERLEFLRFGRLWEADRPDA